MVKSGTNGGSIKCTIAHYSSHTLAVRTLLTFPIDLLTPVPRKSNVFSAFFVELTFWKISRTSAKCRKFVRT